jgi:methionyl-tRNA synthetase
MGNNKIVKGLGQVRSLIDFGNRYIDEKKPWEMKKKDPDDFASVMKGLVELLRHIAWMIRPFVPETSNKILVQLGVFEIEKENQLSENKVWKEIDLEKIKEGESLFPRIK